MFIRISFLLITSTVCAFAQQENDTLTFATYRYATNDRVKNIKPFADYFGRISGSAVRVVSYNSVHELVSAMADETPDFVFINTFGYLLSREHSSAYAIAAALHVPDTSRSTYQSVIVSNRSSDIRSLADLQKRKSKVVLHLVNPGSTSGNLIPRLHLAQVGIAEPENFFTRIEYTRNHALTLQNVINGKADLGAFGSEEYYKAINADKTLRDKVNLLWESGPIPLGPVMYSSHLKTALKDKFVEALLTLQIKDADALDAIKAGWTEALPANKFHKVDSAYYDALLMNNKKEGMRIIRQFAH